jgi:two-component system CheB/CheR fusion protein
MHGGTITAASAGRDRGAAFTLALRTEPAASPADPREAASQSATEQPRARVRVLLVEDHADTARVLAKLLRDSGHEVTTANDAASALRAAASKPFDIVVSDLGLPDATGFELMRQVRDRHGLKGVALSGYGMEDDMRKSRESGFVEHLVKPVDLPQLQAVITRVIGRRRGGR